MSIVDVILGKSADQRKAAWQEYAELLDRDDASASAVAKLTKAMDILGRKPEDLPGDRQIILRVRMLRKSITDGSGLAAAISQAKKAVTDFNAETASIVADRQEGHSVLVQEAALLSGRDSMAQRSVHELNALKSEHSELLAHIPAAKVEDLGRTQQAE